MFSKTKESMKLVKAAWSVFKEDKKILKAYIVQALITIALVAGFGGVAYSIGVFDGFKDSIIEETSEYSFGVAGIALFASMYLVLRLLTEFTTAYVVVTALARFRGEPLDHSGVMEKVSKHKSGIVKFGLFSATVGGVLSALEERLPFAGAVAAWLVNAAWQIATMFAIPVIVDKGEDRPLIAARESVSVVKKTFGDNIRVNFGLGILALLSVFAAVLATVPAAIIASVAGLGSFATALIVVVPPLLVVTTAILITTALGAIIKAGLYEYAMSGTTYGEFNQAMFKQMVTEKKARKIFGF